MKKFKDQEITLSQSLTAIWRGKDTVLNDFANVPIKLIVWHDSLLCGSCEISKMSAWNETIKYADSLAQWFRLIYLFTPKKGEYRRLIMALKADRFDYPVFIDHNATFIKQNLNLPKNRQLHSFLLDKNNKVVLVGSPLYNFSLWELYKRTINELIENDGILRER